MYSLQGGIGNAAVSRLLAGTSPGALLQRAPEIRATDKAIGKRVVETLTNVNAPHTATSGVHYAGEYQRLALTDADAKAFWKEEYLSGYADPAFFEHTGYMSWELLPSADAAAAIKAWLKGPTIAECASVLVAIELDTIRAAVGDKRFNELFADLPDQPAERGRLRVTLDATKSSLAGFLRLTDAASDPDDVGDRSVKKGEVFYFGNHPMYLLKHPAGAWRGENVVCVDDTSGAQKYSGFGVGALLESEMLTRMALEYQPPRDERDFEVLVRTFAPAAADAKTDVQTWATVYDGIEATHVHTAYQTGGFPEEVTAEEIIAADPLKIGEIISKGGFQFDKPATLDAEAVGKERGA